MTDNRTNVQIVADALRSMPEAERDDDRDPAVVVAEYAVAALSAAQGAAPQAHDAEVAAEAVEKLAESYVYVHAVDRTQSRVYKWLRARAAEYRKAVGK